MIAQRNENIENCVNETGHSVEGTAHGRAGLGCEGRQIVIQQSQQQQQQQQQKFRLRIATLNVGTMKGRAGEVAESLTRRNIDLCCVQEVRWRGESARMITGKDSRYKFFWKGNAEGFGGVGIMLAERWIEKVISVDRVNERMMVVKLMIGKKVLTVVSVYAPQSGLDDHIKEEFYDNLIGVVSKFGESEMVLVAGDLNGHVGRLAEGYEGVHGGYGYGRRNIEGVRILEFGDAMEMTVVNTTFRKKYCKRKTFQSGNTASQIDYVLVRRKEKKNVKDVRIYSEECAPQHKLVVCELLVTPPQKSKRVFIPRLKIWKLRDPVSKEEYGAKVREAREQLREARIEGSEVEGCWSDFKNCLLNVADSVCGWTKGPGKQRVTWWWNETVERAVKEKRERWREFREGRGNKEDYLEAKRRAKHEVHVAKKSAEGETFSDATSSNQIDKIFKIARQMSKTNQDVVGEKCIRNDLGELAVDVEAKKEAWKCYYSRLLNEEFEWDRNNLPAVDPIEGPAVWIEDDWIKQAVRKMKCGKAPGPSGIVAEMMKASGEDGIKLVAKLANTIVGEGVVPSDWENSYIINCYKGKGEAMERSNHRGLKLLDQAMKIFERVIEKLIRERVNIGDMQFGFMPGRGTTDAIFIVRQLQEKYLAGNRELYVAFVDLEKAFDRVPREIVWWALRRLGVEEWLVGVVKALYVNAKSCVRVNGTYSDSFEVRVGLHQGSVLSPLLFVIVMETISREFRTGCPWELLYADDLVLIAESMDDLSEKFQKWKDGMETKGLRVNTGKTKVLISGRGMGGSTDSGKWPCSVCRKGVGSNSIYCRGCKSWVHKRCSGVRGSLAAVRDFRCIKCVEDDGPVDEGPIRSVVIGHETLEVVDKFCYLGDVICASGGVKESAVARTRSGWKKFRELLPVLTARVLSLTTKGKIYESCVRSVMLYGSETWGVKEEDLVKLERNENAMIRWMCGVSVKDRVASGELRGQLSLENIRKVVQRRRLRWFRHVERMEAGSCVRQSREMQAPGIRRRGRPRKTWDEVVRNDLRVKGLQPALAQDRVRWRRAIM